MLCLFISNFSNNCILCEEKSINKKLYAITLPFILKYLNYNKIIIINKLISTSI